jgi:hypothetical protein
MAFISLNSRVVEHRTRLVCLGETPSPRVRCLLAMFTYLLTYLYDRYNTLCSYIVSPPSSPDPMAHTGPF